MFSVWAKVHRQQWRWSRDSIPWCRWIHCHMQSVIIKFNLKVCVIHWLNEYECIMTTYDSEHIMIMSSLRMCLTYLWRSSKNTRHILQWHTVCLFGFTLNGLFTSFTSATWVKTYVHSSVSLTRSTILNVHWSWRVVLTREFWYTLGLQQWNINAAGGNQDFLFRASGFEQLRFMLYDLDNKDHKYHRYQRLLFLYLFTAQFPDNSSSLIRVHALFLDHRQ